MHCRCLGLICLVLSIQSCGESNLPLNGSSPAPLPSASVDVEEDNQIVLPSAQLSEVDGNALPPNLGEAQQSLAPASELPTPEPTPEPTPGPVGLNVGGTPIEQADWTIRSHDNLSFGNHLSDAGFTNSNPMRSDSVRITVKKGSHRGNDAYFVLPPGVQEAWVSYCIRFGSNWTTSVGGKLPGFSGDSSPTNGGQGGKPSSGNNAWSARMLYGTYDTTTNAIPLGVYVYHSAYSERSNYGDPDWWAPLPDRLFSQAFRANHNRWYAIKQRIKMNSKGVSNGLIEGWIDGSKLYSRDQLHFTDNDEFREIYRFWLDVYHGGSETSPHDQHVYFDQINYSIGSDETHANCQN